MKKNFILMFALLLSLSISSQVALNQGNTVPALSSSFKYVNTTSYIANYAGSGSGNTWDFSSVTGNTVTLKYDTASKGSDGANHSGASLYESGSTGENYYSSSAAAYSMVGSYIAGVARITWSDAREFITFPMQLSKTSNNTFSGTVTNFASSQNFQRSGSLKVIGAAEGMLKLPTITINSVLEVMHVANYTDKYQGTTIATYTDSIILWYDGYTNNFLASYTRSYANGSIFLTSFFAMDSSSVVKSPNTSIATNVSESGLKVYPNPTIETVYLNSSKTINEIQVVSLNGEVKYSNLLGNNTGVIQIPDDWSQGNYILYVLYEDGTTEKRVLLVR